jgi:hypothetical protein
MCIIYNQFCLELRGSAQKLKAETESAMSELLLRAERTLESARSQAREIEQHARIADSNARQNAVDLVAAAKSEAAEITHQASTASSKAVYDAEIEAKRLRKVAEEAAAEIGKVSKVGEISRCLHSVNGVNVVY